MTDDILNGDDNGLVELGEDVLDDEPAAPSEFLPGTSIPARSMSAPAAMDDIQAQIRAAQGMPAPPAPAPSPQPQPPAPASGPATDAHMAREMVAFDEQARRDERSRRKKAKKDADGKYSARGEARLAMADIREGLAAEGASIGSKALAVLKFLGRLVHIFFRSIWRVLVGIAVVAVVFCVIAAGGLGYLYLSSASELPNIDDYTQVSMPQDSTIYDVDGEVIGVISSVSREAVGFGSISQPMKDAIVAIEDERFYNHQGVDLQGIARALYYNYREWRSGGSETSQGASTITQQYVRNAYEQVGTEQTIGRKMTEMMLAAQLEMEMSKDDILNSYLNTIYFGNGCYGVEAASKFYFGHSADSLDHYESAVLSSIINAPSIYDPSTPEGREETAKRANVVLDKMYSLGKLGGMTQEDLRALKQTNIDERLVMKAQEKVVNQPFYYDYVMNELYASYTKAQVESGGWQVYTTLSIEDGEAAEEVVAGIEDSYGNGITAAIADVDVDTGAVHAFCGGTDYARSQFNIATTGRLQTGSTLKPLLYAALCEYDGYYMTDEMDCSPVDIGTPDSPHVITPYISGSKATLRQGVIASDNAMAIHAAQTLGMDKFKAMAKAVGIDNPIEDNVVAVIGGQTEGLTPLELASGYSTVARKGQKKARWCIETITDGLGNEVYRHSDESEEKASEASRTYVNAAGSTVAVSQGAASQGQAPSSASASSAAAEAELSRKRSQAMSSEVALQVTDSMCAAVDEAGWYNIPFDKKGWQIAAKTGTTNDDMDSWCVGFDHDRSVAIWVGGRDERMTVYNSSYNTTGAFSRYFEAVGQDDAKGEFEKPQWKTEVPARQSGEELDSYREALASKNLGAEIEYVSADNADNNQLLKVEGEGTLVPRYSKVKLQVARDMVEVPDFTAMSISEVYARAKGLDVDFEVTYSNSGLSTPTVSSQSVEAGSLVASGTKITLGVTVLVANSSGQSVQQVPVRGTAGAMSLLSSEKSQVESENSQLQSQADSYRKQLESSGTPIPDVSGLTATQARKILTSIGLKVSYNGEGSDTVLSMVPAAGNVVSSGDTITLRSASSTSQQGTSNTSNTSNSSRSYNSSSGSTDNSSTSSGSQERGRQSDNAYANGD